MLMSDYLCKKLLGGTFYYVKKIKGTFVKIILKLDTWCNVCAPLVPRGNFGGSSPTDYG